jgi:hypothetical protein
MSSTTIATTSVMSSTTNATNSETA